MLDGGQQSTAAGGRRRQPGRDAKTQADDPQQTQHAQQAEQAQQAHHAQQASLTRSRGRGLTRIEAMVAGKTSVPNRDDAAAPNLPVESASKVPAGTDALPAGSRPAPAVRRPHRLQTSIAGATSDEGQPPAGTGDPPAGRTPNRKRSLKEVLQGGTNAKRQKKTQQQQQHDATHAKERGDIARSVAQFPLEAPVQVRAIHKAYWLVLVDVLMSM